MERIAVQSLENGGVGHSRLLQAELDREIIFVVIEQKAYSRSFIYSHTAQGIVVYKMQATGL